MTDVTVTSLGNLRFGVGTVKPGGARTGHTVSVPQELLAYLGLGTHDAERLVRESFAFLLEREPPNQILREFSLDAIGRYFPVYRSEIAVRLGR